MSNEIQILASFQSRESTRTVSHSVHTDVGQLDNDPGTGKEVNSLIVMGQIAFKRG